MHIRHIKRRSSLRIISNILERTKEPATKKDIMYDVRLSFSQTKDFVELLIKLEYLKRLNRKEQILYVTTKKGLKFCEGFKEIDMTLQKLGKWV